MEWKVLEGLLNLIQYKLNPRSISCSLFFTKCNFSSLNSRLSCVNKSENPSLNNEKAQGESRTKTRNPFYSLSRRQRKLYAFKFT